jgi:hypothetical protein
LPSISVILVASEALFSLQGKRSFWREKQIFERIFFIDRRLAFLLVALHSAMEGGSEMEATSKLHVVATALQWRCILRRALRSVSLYACVEIGFSRAEK